MARPNNTCATLSELNNKFQKIILYWSGNKPLIDLMSGFIEMTVVLRTYHRYGAEEINRSFGYDRELISVLEVRDDE